MDDETQAAGQTTLGLGTGDSPTWAGGTFTNCAVLGSNSAEFKPTADSATFFQVKDEDGNIIGNFDTVNNRFGLGTDEPSSILGIINAANEEQISIRQANGSNVGAIIFETSAGCGRMTLYNADGNGKFRFDATGDSYCMPPPGTRGFGIGDTSPDGMLEVRQTGAADIFNLYDGSTNVLTVIDGGFLGLNESAPETLIEMTHASPYITTHCSTHTDAATRLSRWIGKGEKSGGEEGTLGIAEWGHDGTGDDYKGYFKISTNANGGADTLVDALTIDSAQNVIVGDGTNQTTISHTGDQTFAGSAGFYPRVLNQSAEPAAGTGATQCDTGEMIFWTDSDDSKCYLCYNHGGTVKTVELP